MNKILIFYGSKNKFLKRCPDEYKNLTYLAAEADRRQKEININVKGIKKTSTYGFDDEEEDEEEDDKRIYVKNFVIDSNEFSGVNDHVIINFVNILSYFIIDNLFIHNRPLLVSAQLQRTYGEIVEVIKEEYRYLKKSHIKLINDDYNNKVIGQDNVKVQLLKSLFPLTIKGRKKPVVMLFYGNSGIGKTETALYLASVLKEKLFRKQFSMFQNNQFSTYLFGGSYKEPSFAKDLLDRESNVILLDEFDKANPYFHSAFYQLFDEGVFVDSNYHVELNKAIIICTSNYQNLDEIKEKLGAPIYNRFDTIIHFKDLSKESKYQIAQQIFDKTEKTYKRYYKLELSEKIKSNLFQAVVECENVREIQHLVEDTFSLAEVLEIVKEPDNKESIT